MAADLVGRVAYRLSGIKTMPHFELAGAAPRRLGAAKRSAPCLRRRGAGSDLCGSHQPLSPLAPSTGRFAFAATGCCLAETRFRVEAIWPYAFNTMN